jgi:hypothetical protein
VGDRGPDQATPDIAAVIQEIVNQDGWASGNSLVLIISDDPANPSQGIRCAEAGPGDDAALLSIEFAEAAPPTPVVLESTIATETDDTEEDLNPSKLGEADEDSSDLEMPYEDTGMGDPQLIGLRYQVDIPMGATITAASVQFQVDELKDGSLPVNLIIEGELSPNAGEFVKGGPGTFDLSLRPRTTAVVQWSVPNWTAVGDRGPDQQTSDISAVIQEIVNQDGWASGNALVLIISDDPANPSTGNRCAEAGPGDDSALLHVEYLEPAPPAGANIIWVAITQDHDEDGVQDDLAWIDWLEAEGHTVDVRLDYWGQLDLEPNKVDELNAADLIIFSRTTSSGHHDEGDEPALWNSVTTPIMLMNAYLVRTNRWLWMNTGSVEDADDILMALDPTHPLFDGVNFEMGNMLIFLDNTVGNGQATFPVGTDVGNGTLIAQRLSADQAWIAEWPAGVEFYAGSGQIAGGRRMLFVAGAMEVDGPPPTTYGGWNLTAEGEKVFRNAINYLVPAAAPEGPSPLAHWKLDEGSGTIAADSSGNALDGTLMGDPMWVAGIIGGALDFDGDDYVDIGNPPILDFSTGDWTLSAWMNAAVAPSGDVTIVGKGGDHSSDALPGVRYQLMLDSSDYLHPVVDDDSSKYDPSGEIPLIDGQWHHVVMMRRNGTELRAYVDGVEDMGVTNHGESTIPAEYDLSGTSKFNAYIGAITHAGNSTPDTVVLEKLMLGMIDDVRIYDVALTEAEVAALASGQ